MSLSALNGNHRSSRSRSVLSPVAFLVVACSLCVGTRFLSDVRNVLLYPAFAQVASRPTSKRPQLKERLRQNPDEAAIAELERTWRPTEAVSSLQQLRGSWSLVTPKENRARGSLSNDLPRMLLNLYMGNIGRMLSMELVSPPQLHIDSEGRTKTETELRWGRQKDRILLQGQLHIAGPNRLREMPKTSRSSSLQLTLPAMQPQRDIEVTYFDRELLIMRDGRGIVDVWWRSEARPAEHSKETSASDGLPVAASSPGSASKSSAVQVENAHTQVEALTTSLEALRNQSKQDHQARKELAAQATRLEKELQAATVDSRADSVMISAIDKLNGEVSKDFRTQEMKSETKVQSHEELTSEVASLHQKSAELEANIVRYQLQEASLKEQIAILEAEYRTGARDAWPAYRAAVAKAKQDLAGVRRDLKTSGKEVSKLKKELTQKNVELKRMTVAVDAELAARQELEAQIEEQQREYQEATVRLSQAADIEKALREELAAVQGELQALEEREAESKRMAAEMEAELRTVAQQVKFAKNAVKGLNSDKKRFWPWR